MSRASISASRPRARLTLAVAMATVSVAALAALASGCAALRTDAATRLAYDIRNQATALRNDGETVTFTHTPKPSPEGCAGAYTVELQKGSSAPGATAALLVGCHGERAYQNHGYAFSTTSHLNAVTVPSPLRAEKSPGEPLSVTLSKHGQQVEVIALKWAHLRGSC